MKVIERSILIQVRKFKTGSKRVKHFLHKTNCLNEIFFVAVFLGYHQYWPGGLMVFVVFNFQELPKAQLAVVLDLNRLRRRGHGLKSHLTD